MIIILFCIFVSPTSVSITIRHPVLELGISANPSGNVPINHTRALVDFTRMYSVCIYNILVEFLECSN